MFCAGIVLYNPESDRINENIEAIIDQVDYVILADNGSDNYDYIYDKYKSVPKVRFIHNKENQGIATALNQICTEASELGAEWILTLDQDSVVAHDLIATYSKYIGQENVGIVCPAIKDRNFTLKRECNLAGQVIKVPRCITSGSFTRIKAWEKIGGFDEKLFIDAVDFDFCFTLRENDYLILRTYETHILHEVGKSKLVKFLWKEDSVYNHSVSRYYYIFRNNIYVGRKHSCMTKQVFQLIKRLYLVMRHENKRGAKLLSICKGIKDGFSLKY